METLTQALKQKAIDLGFSWVGVVPATPSPTLSAYLRWVERGYMAKMGYMARPDRIVRRQDLNVILPNVQVMVCVGVDYFTQSVPPFIGNDPSRGRISNYAWGGVDYHDLMTPRLQELGQWLEAQTETAVASKVYVDTGAILERSHGQTAVASFIGKNTMMIRPQHGSFFFLGELLTTLPLAVDSIHEPVPSCGQCTRCLTACPTNAFPEPYVLDAGRCISYLTIELKGWIPRELRPLIGNWIYGCDICQEVCPFNRFAQPTRELAFVADGWEEAAPSLLELLALTPDEFKERFDRSPIKRIKYPRFLRNVCVAVGNWGRAGMGDGERQTAVSLLHHHLTQAEAPLVRGHAAWALGHLGAKKVLEEALLKEADETVQMELNQALLACG